MASNPPPSSRLRPAGDSALQHARGELRDAVGALNNLDQLLRSLRVGPRALASVLPDVHSSCVQLSRSAGELLKAIADKLLPDTRATDALGEFIVPRIAELERELALAMRRSMTAKHRLHLERVISRLTSELDGARELIDLLEEATSAPGVRVDLKDLLQQTFTRSDAEGTLAAPALQLPDESLELYLSPRVAMALFTIAVDFAGRDGHPLRISMRGTGSDECTIVISRDEARSALRKDVRRVIEPIALCLEAAARLLGAELEQRAGGAELSFVWPAGSNTRRRAGNG
jgi:hypothetical protein